MQVQTPEKWANATPEQWNREAQFHLRYQYQRRITRIADLDPPIPTNSRYVVKVDPGKLNLCEYTLDLHPEKPEAPGVYLAGDILAVYHHDGHLLGVCAREGSPATLGYHTEGTAPADRTRWISHPLG